MITERKVQMLESQLIAHYTTRNLYVFAQYCLFAGTYCIAVGAQTYRGRRHVPLLSRLWCPTVLLSTPVQQFLTSWLLSIQNIQGLLELFGSILKKTENTL